MSFPIIKVSATGNDFLLIDLLTPERRQSWEGDWASADRAQLAQLWCNRFEGLGADGLVFLEVESGCDFRWDFLNSDGGRAEMCGNAARAVSYYFQQTYGPTQIKFKTVVGMVEAEVASAEEIRVQLPAVAESEWSQVSARQTAFDFVRAGVPHAVVAVTQMDDRTRLRELAAEIKSEARFQSAGVNVTFVNAIGTNRLRSVTFERGVEDFTLACGTGAIAAAYSVTRGADNQEVEVQVPGGRLIVVWKNGRPLLTGPAKIVAEMHAVRS